MRDDPLVSVVITAYNLGWCIEDTLDSVLAQTYRPLEVIVVDDASTDDTQTRVAPYLNHIRYIRHETNQGVARNAEAGPARNTGIRAASGDFVALLDGDDLWHPEKIARQVAAAKRFPDAGMIIADGVSFTHEDQRELHNTLLFDYGDSYFESLPLGAVVRTNLYDRFLSGCLVDTPSQVMVASRVFTKVGLFSECRCDDYEFYIRATEHFDTVVVKEPLVRYRVHASSLSGVKDSQYFKFVPANIEIWKNHAKECRSEVRGQIDRQIRRTLAEVAQRAQTRGVDGEARWALRYLAGLFARNWRSIASPYVALRATLVICPEWTRRAARPIMRRIHRVLTGAASACVLGLDPADLLASLI